jgi:signal transduction histidine kinase
MRRLQLFLLLFMLGATHAADPPAPPQRQLRVLLLFPSDLLLPWALDQAQNTKTAIRAALPRGVDFFAEGLDALRLTGPEYEEEFVALLLKRYRAIPPDLIVVHGPMGDFVQRHRAALWPQTPLMAASVMANEVQLSGYPADIPGTTVSIDITGTIALALKLDPEARRLVVVGGSSQFNRAELALTRKSVEGLRDRLEIEYLEDGSQVEMEQRLAALPRDSIVFQLPIFRDGKGDYHTPHELAARLAGIATAPSYTYYEQGIGIGLVGGATTNWAGQQDMIGKIARELLMGGTRKESLLMHPPTPSLCAVDWRAMKHWQLPLARLPEGCQVQFRELSFWDKYRKECLVIGFVLLIQSALIIALILQRQRRQVAELELHHQRTQLAHAARLATVGELSASIAHEINQPLAAILTNAEVGESLIKSGSAKMAELHEIFTSIRDDDLRAVEVIKRMRQLLRHEPNEALPLDVNEAVQSILRLTIGLAKRNGVTLNTELDPSIPRIKGDFVQVQQVLLNLIVNAVDAVAGCPPERRRVTISTAERPAGKVEVSVNDSGPGIAAEKIERIFEPFFSTKHDGMGLGLSITRTIVQAHRGRIWAESNGAGATFHFSIPA